MQINVLCDERSVACFKNTWWGHKGSTLKRKLNCHSPGSSTFTLILSNEILSKSNQYPIPALSKWMRKQIHKGMQLTASFQFIFKILSSLYQLPGPSRPAMQHTGLQTSTRFEPLFVLLRVSSSLEYVYYLRVISIARRYK